MDFSERTQAFLAAKYYEHLQQMFGERGVQAFIHAVKHYAMQRGSRMAQRAIRDGETLNYETFCRYGEWAPSKEAIETGTASMMNVKSVAPDFEYHVTSCPWQLQFEEMGAKEAGSVYCTYLDEAINQGFNGEIDFHTIHTKHHAKECVFMIREAGLTPESDTKRIMKYVKGFDYHCAHTFYSFGEIVKSVFGEDGEEVCQQVLKDFKEQYGEKMAEQLKQYEYTNFNCC